MRTHVITKQRAGQSESHFNEYWNLSWDQAKAQFKRDMTSELFEKNGEYEDECGNRIWGFRDNGKTFCEDVFTYRLKTLKESKEFQL